jgi:uncharacterized protein with GYD domain
MATYITLGTFTDQGARNLADLGKAVEANMARGERLGIKVLGWYLTQGRYDIVVVAEAPDAETMLAQAAGVAGTGNIRTETLRAFTLEEAEKALKKAASG